MGDYIVRSEKYGNHHSLTAAGVAELVFGDSHYGVRFAWTDSFAAMKVDEEMKLIDGYGNETRVTRVDPTWPL